MRGRGDAKKGGKKRMGKGKKDKEGERDMEDGRETRVMKEIKREIKLTGESN